MSVKGLNGTPVLTIKDVFVGTVPGADYGYKRNLRVTVDIRMERLDRREYETTEHDMVSGALDFAITTSVWKPNMSDSVAGGATMAPLRELVTYAPGFNAVKANTLAKLGERWHLNGMRAGCVHQTPVYKVDRPNEYDLDATPACPVTGYKFGHAWLLEVLPDGFIDTVKSLLPISEAGK